MINYLWSFMIIIAFVCAIFTGRMQNLSDAVALEAKSAVDLMVTLASSMCFWSGIFKIMEKCGICEKFSKFLSPVINFLFRDVKNQETKNAITMNVTSNIIGLGNAATPFGIKAMQHLQKENPLKSKASNAMCRFVLLNTASIQLIPTTLIAVRLENGGISDNRLLFCIWISSFLSCFIGLIFCYIGEKVKK